LASLKLSNQKSTANTIDAEVDGLLASAAYIMNNPDEFIGADSEVAAVSTEAVAA